MRFYEFKEIKSEGYCWNPKTNVNEAHVSYEVSIEMDELGKAEVDELRKLVREIAERA